MNGTLLTLGLAGGLVALGAARAHGSRSSKRGSPTDKGAVLAQAEAQQNRRKHAIEQAERDILLRHGPATTMGGEGRDITDQLDRASVFSRIRMNELDDEHGRVWALKQFNPLRALRDEMLAHTGALYDLRQAAGFDPRTGLPKEGPRNTVENVSEGEYGDALLPTAEFRSNCTDPVILSDDGVIEHAVCRWRNPRDAWHHLRYFVNGEAVAALSLRQTNFPVRGKPNATIDVVYVDPDHRGHGYASMLMDEAKDYFGTIKHSTDLTQAGAAWKATVQNRVKR